MVANAAFNCANEYHMKLVGPSYNSESNQCPNTQSRRSVAFNVCTTAPEEALKCIRFEQMLPGVTRTRA